MLEYHRGTEGRLQEHGDRFRADGTLVVSQQGRMRQQAMTLRPPSTERIGVWRHEMTAAERERFEAVAGELLAELGYERNRPDIDR